MTVALLSRHFTRQALSGHVDILIVGAGIPASAWVTMWLAV